MYSSMFGGIICGCKWTWQSDWKRKSHIISFHIPLFSIPRLIYSQKQQKSLFPRTKVRQFLQHSTAPILNSSWFKQERKSSVDKAGMPESRRLQAQATPGAMPHLCPSSQTPPCQREALREAHLCSFTPPWVIHHLTVPAQKGGEKLHLCVFTWTGFWPRGRRQQLLQCHTLHSHKTRFLSPLVPGRACCEQQLQFPSRAGRPPHTGRSERPSEVIRTLILHGNSIRW